MHQPFGDLPPRLARLLTPIASGRSNAEIAAALGLSPHTVANYVSEIMAHAGIASRPRLIVAILAWLSRDQELLP